MELSCEVYEDLLLLYEDGLCSDETKRLVEGHLAGCDRCSQYLKKMRLPEEMAREEAVRREPAEAALAEKESLQKSFRKIRRRWAMSLLVLPVLLLLSGPVMMVVSEARGEGICFSNLDDIWQCHRFWKLMSRGEYEKAVEMLDYSDTYVSVRATLAGETHDGQTEEVRQMYYAIYGDVLNMSQEEFEHQEQQKVVAYLRENEPVMLKSYSYDYAYRTSNNWIVSFELVEGVRHPDKVGVGNVRYSVNFSVTANGMRFTGSTSPEHYVKDDRGFYLFDEEGDLIEQWSPEEELVFFDAFRISTSDVGKMIYEWHQSSEQQPGGD